MAAADGFGTGFHAADYVIFVLFLVISCGIGIFYACHGGRQKTNSEFLMGNRKLHTLPVAISIVVSFVSGVLVLGHPAEMYTRGTQFSMRMVGHALACLLATLLFVPMFFKLNVTSSFEYLEARYRSKCVKLMGTITLLMSMLIQVGIVLYAPAVALQAVNGIPIWASVIVTSTVAILYTTLGGMKAVIWTDVFQAFCMVAGMLAIVITGTIKVGGFEKVWELNSRDGRIEFFNFDPDPTVRASFWSTVFGAACISLSVFGVGQTTVQRYCALPTLRQAKQAVMINAFFLVLLYALASAVGLVIYAFYSDAGCDPLRARYITSQNQLVPYFVSNVLNYPGLPGAFLAVLFGGALSTMSSNLNSAAAITWQDILKYFFEHLAETKRTKITKLLVLIYGAIGIGIAFTAKFMGSHVMQGLTAVLGTFAGPTLGLFMLGALFPFANSKGAVVGCSIATAFNVWIAVGSMLLNPHKTTLPTSIDNCNATATTWLPPFSNETNGLYYGETNVSSLPGNQTLFNESTTSSVISLLLKSASNNFNEDFTFYNDNTTSLFNASSGVTRVSFANVLEYLYTISFNLYPIIGLFNTIVIGIVVSLLTGCNDTRKLDRRLMIPVFERLCCCCCCLLPASLRRFLRCGIDYDDEKAETAIDDNIRTDVEADDDCCHSCITKVSNNNEKNSRISNGKQMSNRCYFNTHYDLQPMNGKSVAAVNGSTLPVASVELQLMKKLDGFEDVEL